MTLETPEGILSQKASSDAAESFVKWRKSLKKPLTERAATMVLKSLMQIVQSGGDADEALDMTQERGWLTVKPDWYWNAKRQEGPQFTAINGGNNGLPYNSQTPKRPDPALEQIARLAGLGET